MGAIILQLVTTSVRGHLYSKAMECLKQFRVDCRRDLDAEPFNVWARPGRLSALSIFHSKSIFYDPFV